MKIFIFFVCFFTSFTGFSQTIYERNLMTKEFNKGYLKESLSQAFHPYAKLRERDFWNQLPEHLRKDFISKGEPFLNKDWIFLPASEYLLFAQTGNRNIYESKVFERWSRLNAEVMAEVMENRGRFMNDIVNGIWSICEESSWCWPAHNSMHKAGIKLPDVTDPFPDLGVGETSSKLAWICYLMPEKLDSISPLIRKRVYLEINKRFLEPVLNREDWSWMIADIPNNWVPWIFSNYLSCVFTTVTDIDRQVQHIEKTCRIVDKFINGYAPDGGCDEGPAYYSHAAASLFDCLDLLSQATNGKFNIYHEDVIKNMASFIIKTHIDEFYFTNFADAPATFNYKNYTGLLYSFGEKTGNSDMQHYASYLNALPERVDFDQQYILGPRIFRNLKYYDHINKLSPKAPFYKQSWFEGIQVMTVRAREGTSKGLFIAAQGGHNAESHNHNDVGNFIVYANGKPVIIDVGVESYTKKTFSSERYGIWTMQSQYHNCPTINGVMQSDGIDYRASRVAYNTSSEVTTLSMNIETAYPKGAEIKSWKRNFTFYHSENKIEISDDYILSRYISPSLFNFMSYNEPVIKNNGLIEWMDKNGAPILQLSYNAKQLEPTIEKIFIEDASLKFVWGTNIYRTVFKVKNRALKNQVQFIFSGLN